MAKIIKFEESKKLKTPVNPDLKPEKDQKMQRLLTELNEMETMLESHFKRTIEWH